MKERVDTKSIRKHIKLLEKRYRKHVGSHLFFPLADAYCKADMLDKAESLLREGLSYHPKYCSAKSLLGEVLFRKGDLKAAQEELEQVVQMVPENIMAHKHLLEIYKQTGSKEAYEKELRIIQMIDHKKSLSEDIDMIAGPISKSLVGGAHTDEPMEVHETEAQPEASNDAAMFDVKESSEGGLEERASGEEVPGASEDKENIFENLKTLHENSEKMDEEDEPSDSESEEALDSHEIADETSSNILKHDQDSESEEEVAKDTYVEKPVGGKKSKIGEHHTEVVLNEEGEHGIATVTLAELYFSQGFLDKALEIYQKLLLQEPDHMEWVKRFQEIQDMQSNIEMGPHIQAEAPEQPQTEALHTQAEAAEQPQTKDKKEQILEILEQWLKNCQALKKSRRKR